MDGPIFCETGRKTASKLGMHKNVSKKAGRLKFYLIKTKNRASLILNIPINTTIASNISNAISVPRI